MQDMDHTNSLRQVVAATHDPDQLIHRLQAAFECLPFPYDDISGAMAALTDDAAPDKEAVLTLYQIELLVCYSAERNYAAIEQRFKLLAPLSMMNQLDHGTLTNLTRVKYHDLYTDYQFLFAPDVKELKLMDLVTKKLTVLALCNSSDTLARSIQTKIYIYYLLCGSDFRKRSVTSYLAEEKIPQRDYAAPIRAFQTCHASGTLIPLAVYQALVSHLETTYALFHAVLGSHGSQFLETFLEGNLSKLGHYYLSITLARIQTLLLGDSSPIDVEDLLYRMIITKKFPEGTTIDQMSQMLRIGAQPQKYDPFNAHVKRVCDTVETLATS